MIDYSFLEFIKPEYVKKEELNKYVKYDSRITRFDVDNWLKWGIINVSDYKKIIKMLIKRQEKELEEMRFMLEKAEKDGEEFSPFIYWGILQGCCCLAERLDYSELEKELNEKIGGKTNA